MKNRVSVLLLVLVVTAGLLGLNSRVLTAARAPAAPTADLGLLPAVPGGVYAGSYSDGQIKGMTLSLFGPKTCTGYGDPFSPLNSIWAPGLYTYTFYIRIPASYPEDVVRVEIFDPDSINNNVQTVTVTRTQAAVAYGLPATATLTCPSGPVPSQINTCALDTGELTGTLSPAQVNPFWYVRVDENRGSGPDDGDGFCRSPSSYTPRYNTQTVYRLFYQADDGSGPYPVPLASYTGQVGDGQRDDGAHQTDLRWVAPGGTPGYDQPAAVPTDCGSPNGGDYDPVVCPGGTLPAAGSGFEISLSQDTPNIVTDPATGDRHLFLEITTVSGASENAFQIWAGLPSYVSTIAGDVNRRNLQILNNPGTHDAAGVVVFAQDYLPQNMLARFLAEVPLTYLGPEYAGATLNVGLFDSDTGTQPPVTFTFDSLAEPDWSLVYGVLGQADPDGVPAGARCLPGFCHNRWVSPAYTITLPGDLSRCDWQNPDPAHCTPFYGGRFLLAYNGGADAVVGGDTFGVNLAVPQPPVIYPMQGCLAAPIGVNATVRSVTPPGSGGTPYPDAAAFDYPPVPPTYDSFVGHQPDVALANAQEGTLFLWHRGASSGDYSWLRWNGGLSPSAQNLANALAWPGSTLDYTNHDDGGQPATPLYPWVVRGYVNPGFGYDLSLSVNDLVPEISGVITGTAVTQTLNEHINLGRYLRLPVWDQSIPGTQNHDYVKIDGFAIFHFIGYRLNQSGEWLLLEFIRWDDSCGQPAAGGSVQISGPTAGYPQRSYTFTATLGITGTVLPVTYTWQATGQAPVVHSSGVTDTVSFSWPVTGTKLLTVTAVSGPVTISGTYAIDILPDNLTLSLAVVGNGVVTVTPDQPLYLYGQGVVLTAVPDPGYIFAGWSGDLGGAANPASLIMDGHKAVTATFGVDPAARLSTVAISGPAQGIAGNVYSFTAQVQPGTAWQPITYTWQADDQTPLVRTGGLSDTVAFFWPGLGTKGITVTAANAFGIVSDTHVIAMLSPVVTLTLVITDANNSVTPSMGIPVGPNQYQIARNSVVTLTAQPDTGWQFVRWGGALSGSGNPETLLMDGDKIVYAEFAVQQFQLVVNTVGAGTVLIAPNQPAYPYGTLVNLTAVPDPGFELINWTGDLTGTTNPANLLMDSDKVVTAGFAINPAAVLASVDLNGPAIGLAGEVITFTAVSHPDTALTPITYTWLAAYQLGITHTAQLTDVVAWSWPDPGVYSVTVVAANSVSQAGAMHTILIEPRPADLVVVGAPELAGPQPPVAHQPVQFNVTIRNSGDVDITGSFYVDLFIDPSVVLTTGIPITLSSGFTMVSPLAAGSSRQLQITAPDGFAAASATHLVYAMVDSLYTVAEGDETNNVSAALVVTGVVDPPVVALTEVVLTGPDSGAVGQSYTFTATVSPVTATLPITYVWEAAGAIITETNGVQDVQSYSWDVWGVQMVTVTAVNVAGTPVTATHTIDLAPYRLYVPIVFKPN